MRRHFILLGKHAHQAEKCGRHRVDMGTSTRGATDAEGDLRRRPPPLPDHLRRVTPTALLIRAQSQSREAGAPASALLPALHRSPGSQRGTTVPAHGALGSPDEHAARGCPEAASPGMAARSRTALVWQWTWSVTRLQANGGAPETGTVAVSPSLPRVPRPRRTTRRPRAPGGRLRSWFRADAGCEQQKQQAFPDPPKPELRVRGHCLQPSEPHCWGEEATDVR